MKKLARTVGNALVTLALPVGIYLVILVISLFAGEGANFASWTLFTSILKDCALGYIVALAMSFNMRNGRIDMSVGGIVVLTSIVAGNLAVMTNTGAWGLMLFSVVLAGVLGLVSGVLYIKLRLPSVILALGLLMLFEAVSQLVFGGNGVSVYSDEMRMFHDEPWIYLVMIVMAIIFHVLTEHTRYAYDTKALAGGQVIACNMGIKNSKNAVLSYLFSGLFLGVASVIYLSDSALVASANNMSSASVMFDAILPSLIGTFLARKSNMALGVFVGVASMKIIKFGLVAMGVNSNFQNVITSIFLIAVIVVIGAMEHKKERDRIRQRAKVLSGAAVLQGGMNT